MPALHTCNQSFVQEYFEKYPKQSEQNNKSQSIAESLKIVHEVMLENNLPTILEGGSTLGFYRNCGVIPHDGDGDVALLGAWLDDKKIKDLNQSFSKRGIELTGSLCPGGSRKTGCEMRAIFDQNHVDLLVYATEKECTEAPCNYFSSLWSGGSTEEGYFYKCDTGPIHFEEASFLGKTFWIPAPTLDYLKGQYGEVWQDPEGGVYKGCHFNDHSTPVPDEFAGTPPPGEYVVKLMKETEEKQKLSSLAEAVASCGIKPKSAAAALASPASLAEEHVLSSSLEDLTAELSAALQTERRTAGTTNLIQDNEVQAEEGNCKKKQMESQQSLRGVQRH